MFRGLILALAASTACLITAPLSGAGAHDRHSVMVAPGPVADGHPFLVRQGGVTVLYPVPPRPLQFALIEGRRALVDPDTLRVVYWLHP